MTFSEFIHSPVAGYLLSGVIVVLFGIVGTLLHKGIKRLESYLDARVSPDDAVKINEFLDAVDQLASLAVHDADSRMVVDMKAGGLFTKEVAASVKQAVIQDVMKNLGPLADKAATALGPIENIVAHAVEKHVLAGKPKSSAAVEAAAAKKSAGVGANASTGTNTNAGTNANRNTGMGN